MISTPGPTKDALAGHAAGPTAISTVDLLVVGGGINGTGIARDAAGRGLSVVLCEKDDLAQGTSSRSSRLIHGGLRYLEHGELRMVRAALRERETLLRIAPHLVQPLLLVLPHVPQMRPAWMLRLGLFLYDHLAQRERLPASRAIWLDRVPEGNAVQPQIRRGFVYADCRTDDARLVVHNALGARELGARILTRHEVISAHCRGGFWQVQMRDQQSGANTLVAARALVNAAGPWVDALAGRLAAGPHAPTHAPTRAPTPAPALAQPNAQVPLPPAAGRIRLIKGSHLVVRRFWSGDHGFLLQNTDRRVVFVTPYEPGYAMIGTTDVDYSGPPDAVVISEEEVSYLLQAVNRQLRCSLTSADVVYSYAGVRALVDDAQENPSAVTRDYVLDLANARPSEGAEAAPLLSVLGGKLTTFRHLAEQVLDMLRPVFPKMGPAWTAHTALPGGDLQGVDAADAQAALLAQANFLPAEHVLGLFNRHGSRASGILGEARDAAGLGQHFGGGLYEIEARHFIAHEWALTAEDVLWRRTKFGLRLDTEQQLQFALWMASAAG